jgi:porin
MSIPRVRLVAGLLACCLCASAAAEERASPRLLGDPGGARSRLERLGIGLQLFYNQLVGGNPRGGADPHGFGHSGSYDLLARVDAEELLGLPDLTGLLHVKGQYDRSVNDDVGSLSDSFDDADFDAPIYVDELWLDQGFAGGRVVLRAGFQEQQTIFDRNAFANSEDRQFLSAFLDNDPLVPLPNALAATLFLRPLPGLTLAAGVADADNAPRSAGFDTAFDGLDSLNAILEASLSGALPGPRGGLPGALRVGVFRDGRKRASLRSGRPQRGHPGVYLSADQWVLRELDGEDEGLGLFARMGWSHPDTAPVEWFWSVGGQYRGLVPGRGRDALGLAVYQAIGAPRSRLGSETGIELYYRAEVLPWLELTPDLQWIGNPGGRRAHENALVLGLRARVGF